MKPTVKEDGLLNSHIDQTPSERKGEIIGHVLGMDMKRFPKAALFLETEGGKEEEEEQKNKPQKTLESEGRAVNVNDLKAVEQTAANRDRWRILVLALRAMFDTGG